MAWGNFWVPLLLFLPIMKQSHEDSDELYDLEKENIPLETYIKILRERKQQKENYYMEIEVCTYKYIHIYIPFILE